MYHCKVKVHSCKLHIINANALLLSHYTNSVQRKRVEWKLWNSLLSLKHIFHVIFHYYFLLYLAKLLLRKKRAWHQLSRMYFVWSLFMTSHPKALLLHVVCRAQSFTSFATNLSQENIKKCFLIEQVSLMEHCLEGIAPSW